jgi:hypothetical protein
LDHRARNAVGIPAVPRSISKPSRASRFMYQVDDLYSRHDGSWKFQIVM